MRSYRSIGVVTRAKGRGTPVAINYVMLTGTVEDPGPKLTYNAAAKPECRLTLAIVEGKGDQEFRLFVPVFVYGAGAERTAEDVGSGDLIAVEGLCSAKIPSSWLWT
jgi:hypothetical protein